MAPTPTCIRHGQPEYTCEVCFAEDTLVAGQPILSESERLQQLQETLDEMEVDPGA